MSRAAKKIEHAHKDSIWSVAYCSEANVIVTGSVDETVKIWFAMSINKCLMHFLISKKKGC